jgi:serine/threonine protein kinase
MFFEPEGESADYEKRTGISLVDEGASEELNFADYYDVKQKLAKGSYGTVFVTEHKSSKEEYAVKVIERSRLSEKDKDLVQREVSILRDCRDIDNVVRLVDYFVAPETYYVVQVYAEGGKAA